MNKTWMNASFYENLHEAMLLNEFKKRSIDMRTVISHEEAAYDAGYQAFRNSVPRDANPHRDEPERQAWFDGWDFAKGVKR
jgi:ribosome modulation factor